MNSSSFPELKGDDLLPFSPVKLTEEVDVESDVFYPITCGEAKATLVWKKFVCPGINVKCVQVCIVLWKAPVAGVNPFSV